MYQQITIKTLHTQGKTNQDIARIMDVHRNTVSNIIKRPEVLEHIIRNRPSSFSTYHTQITNWMNLGYTKLKIWQILKDDYQLTPTYSAFLKYCKSHHKKSPQAYIVQTPPPGEEAEVDFGYAGLIPASEGKQMKVWIFVMTLSYSRLGYYGAAIDQSATTFMTLHQEAFVFFGGVPRTVKVDNLKAAIIKNTRYDLEFTREFLEFSQHYNFVIKPCSPFEPNQKGKVENGVGYVKKNFLSGRTFTDLADLRSQLRDWMINTANVRIHGTTKFIPKDVFTNEEKPYLQPLPEKSFTIIIPVFRKVKLNCHINYLSNYYSVPSQYVGEMVEVRPKGGLLSIYINNEEIATHTIASGMGHFITNPIHYPSDRVYSQTTFQTKYEEKMKGIGENAHLFFKQLVSRDHLWVRVVRKLMGLAQTYGNEKVDRALKRAMAYGAYKPSSIERILEEHLEDAEIEPNLLTTTSPPVQTPELPTEKQTEKAPETQPTNEQYTRDLTYYMGVGKSEKKTEVSGAENCASEGTEKPAEKQPEK
jgi:transposase